MDKQLLYQKLFDAKSDCLSEEQLLDYVQGNLSHKEQHQVETHLLSCDLCDEAVEGLLLIEQERRSSLILSIKKNISKHTEKRNYWAWAAIFSGIFISISSIFYFTDTIKSDAESKAMAYDEVASPTMATEPIYEDKEMVTESVREEPAEIQMLDKKESLVPVIVNKEGLASHLEKNKVAENIKFDSIVLQPSYSLNNTTSSNFKSIEDEIEISEDPTILNRKDYHRKLLKLDQVNENASDSFNNEFSIQKTAVNDEDFTEGEMMEKEILDLNDMVALEDVPVETTPKNSPHHKKKSKSESKGNSSNKSDEKKDTDLIIISQNMKNIAFSKIINDSSNAYYQLTKHNYQKAYSLYQKKLEADSENSTLIYKTAVAGVFYNADLKEVEDLIDEIDHTEKGKWLKASVYLQNKKEKKAKKILKVLANTPNVFQKNAQNILLNLE